MFTTIGMKTNVIHSNVQLEDIERIGPGPKGIEDSDAPIYSGPTGPVHIVLDISGIQVREKRETGGTGETRNIYSTEPFLFYSPIKFIRVGRRKYAKVHPECNPRCGGPVCSGNSIPRGFESIFGNRVRSKSWNASWEEDYIYTKKETEIQIGSTVRGDFATTV
jgi:hypothetical protein